jgi:hypothetical protein
MRTKALFCAAALAATSLAASAQTYSLNVVGYVNIALTNGYNMIANQLDLDGTLTNNTIWTIFGTNMPVGTSISGWDPAAATFRTTTFLANGKWSGTSVITNLVNSQLMPGKGVFVHMTNIQTLTLVGQVIQGTNSYSLVNGYQQMSSFAPISATISNLGYLASTGDSYITWNPSLNSGNGAYQTKTLLVNGNWSGSPSGQPTPAVGQAFFLRTTNAVPWVQSFVIPN